MKTSCALGASVLVAFADLGSVTPPVQPANAWPISRWSAGMSRSPVATSVKLSGP
jgi:hypothetical protein